MQENEQEKELFREREPEERQKWIRQHEDRECQLHSESELEQRDRLEWECKRTAHEREEHGRHVYREQGEMRALETQECEKWAHLESGLEHKRQEREKQERQCDQQDREKREYKLCRGGLLRLHENPLNLLPCCGLQFGMSQPYLPYAEALSRPPQDDQWNHEWRTREQKLGLEQALGLEALKKELTELECNLQVLEQEHKIRQEKLSSTFLEIERLSTWVPSSANKRKLGGALKTAKEQLDQLGGDTEYHDYLRDFMTRHHILCAFIIGHAEDITDQNAERIAEMSKELRKMTQKLRKAALKKANGYERLYEDFIANREGLSHLLDSANAGQGTVLGFIECVIISDLNDFCRSFACR